MGGCEICWALVLVVEPVHRPLSKEQLSLLDSVLRSDPATDLGGKMTNKGTIKCSCLSHHVTVTWLYVDWVFSL